MSARRRRPSGRDRRTCLPPIARTLSGLPFRLSHRLEDANRGPINRWARQLSASSFEPAAVIRNEFFRLSPCGGVGIIGSVTS